MTNSILAAVAILIFLWAIISGALVRRNVTGAMVFTVAGYILGNPDWGWLPVDVETATIHLIAEVTLALVLFSDASRVNLRELRRDLLLPTRLLAIGLPLSVLLGTLGAAVLLAGLPWALAAFLGAALAPTDAALSVQVIEDERIPERLRRALNVESGLNDGIATPIVTVTLAVAASQLGFVTGSESYEAGSALRELGLGLLVGLVTGAVGALGINRSRRHSWMETGARRIAVFAIAIASLSLALAVHGNGFISAFVAGIVFGALLDKGDGDLEHVVELPALGGELLALVVWFLFGAALVPIAFDNIDAALAVYALVGLTIVRMIPVSLGLLGSGLDVRGTMFIGWFGPRGLASVVFALLALEELGDTSAAVNRAVAAVALTVLFSVLLHGVSAGPGGRRYIRGRNAPTAPRP